MPREALQALQLKRVRATLRNLRDHVAPIRRRSRPQASRRKTCVRSTTWRDCRSRPRRTCATTTRRPAGASTHALARVHASSGTTASRPWWRTRTRTRHVGAADGAMPGGRGGPPRRPRAQRARHGLFTGGLGVHYGAERLGAVVVPVSGARRAPGRADRRLSPRVICVTPSYALQIVEVAAQMGSTSRAAASRSAVRRRAVERADARRDRARPRVVSHDLYGLSEVMGPGVACECDERAGCTAGKTTSCSRWSTEDGPARPEGEAGELVVTTLTKEALPICATARATSRDWPPHAVAAGRTHVRILRVTGRNDDMLIVRASTSTRPRSSRRWSANRTRAALPDRGRAARATRHVTVEVEAEGGCSPEHYDVLEHRAIHHLKSLLGLTVDVVVRPPGTFERSTGKAVRVRDLRPKLH